MKLNALIKVAISARVLGTAFGGAIGALPGLLELNKFKGAPTSEKSRIVGKILLGAGIGGTVGNIGGHFFGKGKSKQIPTNSFEEFFKDTPVLKRIVPGAIIGGIPGAIELTAINQTNTGDENKKIFNKGVKKMLLGGSIGGAITSQNNLFNRISNYIR